MCFFVASKIKIAEEDIVCYKTLEYGSKSVYRNYKYDYRAQPKIKLRQKNGLINKGYHSYSTLDQATFMSDYCLWIWEFKIPKGAKYYENPFDEEYVSETIQKIKRM